MNRFLYFIGAALLIVAVGFEIARADFGTNRRGWGRHGGLGGFPAAYMAHELNLTDAQKTQIKELWAAQRLTVAPLLRQVLDGCKEMAVANTNGTFDETKTRLIAGKQAATVSQLLVEKQRLISKIYSEVLTPQQRAKADHLRERMHLRVEGFLDHLEHPTE